MSRVWWPSGSVVEALLAAGLVMSVIAPGQIKALRGRYGSAGNKDDRFDAFVLADVVRTDRMRLTPLQGRPGRHERAAPVVPGA
jgi:hypothetical protein